MNSPTALSDDMGWGDRIRVARDTAGLSQAKLGKLIGKAQTTVDGYEKGNSEPSLETFELIARHTQTLPQWLAFGVGARGAVDDEGDYVDRDILMRTIAETERIQAREAYQLSPNEKATLVLAVHDRAKKEGGIRAIRGILERYLAQAKSGKP